MKPRLTLLLLGLPALHAADRQWTGAAGSGFEDPLNWSAPPADNLVDDLAVFGPDPAPNQPLLTAPRGLLGLRFTSPAGGWTLGGAHPLALGTGGVSSAGQSAGANEISADLAPGAAQTWQAGSGGTLRFSGSLAQSGGFVQTIGHPTHNGTLVWNPVPGKSVALTGPAGSGTNLLKIVNGGRLELGETGPTGTTAIHEIRSSNGPSLSLAAGGALRVRSGTWNFGDIGRNSSLDAFNGSLLLTGGTLAFSGGRYLGGGTITVEDGNLLFTHTGSALSNGGRFGLGNFNVGATAQLVVAGGTVDLAQANSGNVIGPVISARVRQTGGIVRNGLTPGGGANGGTATSLTLGHGGLNVGGSGSTLTHTAVSGSATAYTLEGGTLLCAGTIQGAPPASPGTNGSAATPPNAVVAPGTGNLKNFNFLGGTLATAAYQATLLGSSSNPADPVADSTAIGTLVNRGGTLAPGGTGTPGKTTITGGYQVGAGTLAIDLAGTTPATAFQNGNYDVLGISGNAELAGDLDVTLDPAFTPAPGDTFTILSAATITGSFANAPFGSRVLTRDGLSTFLVSLAGNTVTLGQHLPVTAPVVTDTSAPAFTRPGDAAVLGVTATSLAPLAYEWRKNGVLIPGANSSALTFPTAAESDSATYEVTITNAAGSTTRSFTLAVENPPATGHLVLDAGASESFAASPRAVGQSWILDGETVGTAATFTYSPAPRDAGTHWLRVVETFADSSTATRHWSVRVRIPTPPSALAYHVSPGGSDSADGSAGAPFATLEKARDTIRLLSPGQRAGGVTVFLRGGTHRRTTTFNLAAQDSGTATAPVVYAAFPGESPVLTSTRVLASAQFAPLAASEHARVAPGVDATRIWETSVAGNPRAATFPSVFNEWILFNALRSSQNSGMLELFYQGERRRISRYPNHDAANDILTPHLEMNGVATGAAADGTAYLNGAGTYTFDNGTTAPVGGAFHYDDADAARVARWQTAIASGGLWAMGYWRVPWQLNAARVGVIDPAKKVIGFVPATNPASALVPNGIGDKYTRPAGSRKEPWWVVNLLEELDLPGEWCVDFNRQRLYFLMDRAGPPSDGEVELSDVGTPLFKLDGASDIRLQGLAFQRHLGLNVQILNGSRNLVLGCSFSRSGNLAIDINGGTGHGVVSSDFEKMASGGVMLRGGTITPALAPAGHFAVNNKFRSFGEVVRVYQAAIDIGFGGPLGSWGQPTVGMRAAHNDIRTSPHAGILWNGYQSAIEYNELSDFTRVSNDLGGIYRFGPNLDSGTVIRYNHLYSSPQGEGIYNDFDHVRTPIYGNTINLKTPSTSSRGYGIWTNTNTAAGGAVPGLPMTLQVFNNIAVNSRSNYSLHSATGGVIENNLSYRKLASDFLWYRVTTNTATNTHSTATSNAATLQSGPNLASANDPGFIDFANDDLRLRPDARAYTELPGFVPVPLEMAGLHADEFRDDSRVWKPFVTTGTATDVGANTATFTGSLAYPQFDANATVRLYWGTTDGGTDPAAWQRVATLGQLRSADLAHTPADLAPGTRHYFRFHAENSAGGHWSESSNSTTTAPLASASGGEPGASSSATPPALAFDADPATAWRSGAVPASLSYDFDDAVRITRYTLVSAAGEPARDPTDWQLLGSYDGVAWVPLDTRSGQTFATRGQALDFGFENPNAYKFYRLDLTANAGDPDSVQLAELQLSAPEFTPDTTPPVLTVPADIVVTGNASGANVSFDVSAVDAVSGNVPATATPPSGSLFAPGTTTVAVSATDATGNTANASFTVTVTAPVLPAPWSVRQIQPFAGVAPGSAIAPVSGSIEVTGTGGASTGGTTGDLWTGNNDSFTYVSQPWTGDGVFTARLATFTSADSSAKAGILFRESTSTGSRYSGIYLMRGSGGAVWAQHKTATGGGTTNVNFFTASSSNRGIPEWIRLVRNGDTFTTFHSEDGSTWTELGSARANLMSGSALSVGLAVAPRTGNTTATALFDNLRFHTPPEDWRQTHFGGSANSGNAADAADPDGDGADNLLEYALGTIPTSATSVARPVLGEADGFLTLTFTPARGDVAYQVEGSSDLVDWNPVPTPSAAPGEPMTVFDTVATATADPPRRFLRLEVTAP